jgi:hypothetical protein
MNSLLFTVPIKNTNYSYNSPPVNTNKNVSFMPHQYSNMRPMMNKTVDPVIPQTPNTLKHTKSMKWGEPTWFFFHTLSEKIKEDKFDNIKADLLNIIYTICGNLPCPDCASHASEYMNGINFNTIRNKKDLKDLFYTFHNTVNQKKGFEIFPYEQLDEKYSKAIFVNIVQNFLNHFKNRHSSIHMIANDLHRGRVVSNVTDWLVKHMDCFEV